MAINKKYREINAKLSQAINEEVSLENLFRFMITEFGYSEVILQSKIRKREIVFVRQLYCYIAIYSLKKKRYGGITLSEIGAKIEKDHATVLHSVKTIHNLCDTNKSILNLVIDTQSKFESRIRKREYTMEIYIKKVTNDIEEYPKINEGNKIYLRALVTDNGYLLTGNEAIVFRTGIEIVIPSNYEGMIIPYQPLVYQYEITILNSPIKIDEFTKSEILIMLKNHGDEDVLIKNGDIIGVLSFTKTEKPDILMINNG